ncbi:MAG: hypothetical protein FHK82_00210 [Sedimenticola thiotaurini]|uniref:Uncharacterized protein n=1 Tax=Sedimenticola thiotaurini TaxID=1543721 RepID=A0A558DGM1_9GAMM|nr:MAG: hypothetical protein FHK82_00210 [Sedimenticola thiotaurini]
MPSLIQFPTKQREAVTAFQQTAEEIGAEPRYIRNKQVTAMMQASLDRLRLASPRQERRHTLSRGAAEHCRFSTG